MIYTQNDFIHELSRNAGLSDFPQEIRSLNPKLHFIKNSTDTSHFFIESILKSIEYNRIYGENPYKLHKGYPSPRSIYSAKLFVQYQGLLISKNEWNGVFEYYQNEENKGKDFDLWITNWKPYPDHYQGIQKTLYLLEVGHFIFNIVSIAKLLNVNFKIEIYDDAIHLVSQSNPEPSYNYENVIQMFLERTSKRTSGAYNCGGISSFKEKKERAMPSDMQIERVMEEVFGKEIAQYICIDHFENVNNHKFENFKGTEIPYTDMNKIYPHANFRSMNYFSNFIFDHSIYKKGDEALTKAILAIGFVAQYFLLWAADSNMYGRPIKSFHINKLEEYCGINHSTHTLFYTQMYWEK